jgi:hypothetical protein
MHSHTGAFLFPADKLQDVKIALGKALSQNGDRQPAK